MPLRPVAQGLHQKGTLPPVCEPLSAGSALLCSLSAVPAAHPEPEPSRGAGPGRPPPRAGGAGSGPRAPPCRWRLAAHLGGWRAPGTAGAAGAPSTAPRWVRPWAGEGGWVLGAPCRAAAPLAFSSSSSRCVPRTSPLPLRGGGAGGCLAWEGQEAWWLLGSGCPGGTAVRRAQGRVNTCTGRPQPQSAPTREELLTQHFPAGSRAAPFVRENDQKNWGFL